MIDKISYELVKAIATELPFADKWAGLVRPLRKRDSQTEKVFPVAINTPSTCDQSDYMALVPNTSKISVMYIEKTSNIEYEILSRHHQRANVSLRLVVWYNLDKITSGEVTTEDILVEQVLKVLPKTLSDSLFTGIKQVHIVLSDITYGTDIVSQYTYNEIKTQFGTHPYGIFAIDLDVWYLKMACPTAISLTEGCVTGKGNHTGIVSVDSTEITVDGE